MAVSQLEHSNVFSANINKRYRHEKLMAVISVCKNSEPGPWNVKLYSGSCGSEIILHNILRCFVNLCG